MFVNAATASPKNIEPNREIAMSALAGSNGCIWASACSNVTFVIPSASARSRARASILLERSTPSAQPDAAARAASSVVWPLPHPMSSTRSVVPIAAASSSRSW
jgi:hypothetical protein